MEGGTKLCLTALKAISRDGAVTTNLDEMKLFIEWKCFSILS